VNYGARQALRAFAPRPPKESSLITCHLTKLETALDQIKKSYPKLKPADAALVASALSLTGRHAIALYDGQQYTWPDDNEALTKAMVAQLEMVNEGIEHTAPKRTAKTTTEEEPVMVTVGLMPNMGAGEKLLEGRDELKTLLSDILQDGVEFVYSGTDLGWQWALDRANFSTIAGHEISRRIKIKASFTEGAVGIEMGTGAPKKRASRSKAAPVEAIAEAPEEEAPEVAEAANE
jgi:hypothetical protein